MMKRILATTAVLAFCALPLAAQAHAMTAGDEMTITGQVVDLNGNTPNGPARPAPGAHRLPPPGTPLHPPLPRPLPGRVPGRPVVGARSRAWPARRLRSRAARRPLDHESPPRHADGRHAARPHGAARHRA